MRLPASMHQCDLGQKTETRSIYYWAVHKILGGPVGSLGPADMLLQRLYLARSSWALLIFFWGDLGLCWSLPNGPGPFSFSPGEPLFFSSYMKISSPFFFCHGLICAWASQKTKKG